VGFARYRQVVLVRALLAEHAKAGLRLIEIERDHLADLPRVVEQLLKLPQRFILFCDDLSFEAGEGDYRAQECSTVRWSRPGKRVAVCHVEPPPSGAGKPERQRQLEARGRRAAPQ
jgi:hypothetical protein